MIRNRYKKVLLVAPEVSSHQLKADYIHVRHINASHQIFPSIYQLNPDLIVLDHNHLGKDIEKIVRRIRGNKFYSKIKICCYKAKATPRADSLLTAIGVDFFIYEEDLAVAPKSSKSIPNIFSAIFDIPQLVGLVPNTSTNL
jgi:hypothetical protein